MLSVHPQSKTSESKTQAIWFDLRDPDPTELTPVQKLTGGRGAEPRKPCRDRKLEPAQSTRRCDFHERCDGYACRRRGAAGRTFRIRTFARALDHRSLRGVAAFDAVAGRFDDSGRRPTSSLEVFVDLCDDIVDRLADSLEQSASELRILSTTAFHVPDSTGRKAIRSNRVIRGQLRHVGRLGDYLSEKRDVLQGLGRAVDFVSEMTADWGGGQMVSRMNGLRQDVASLEDYEVHLADKVQFLLDAMVGLIGIAQNVIFKILTIDSIAGIPPTLIAGIYGMNFKGMPEYDWAYGYPYGLMMIALSTVIPLAWFKWRGWF
jgi:magnesium transporter